MANFAAWCAINQNTNGNVTLTLASANPHQTQVAISSVAAVVPSHYLDGQLLANTLRLLGRPHAAAHLEAKLPSSKSIRSGDLGEILATEWINQNGNGFQVPIRRLRWKDHRNMAMRGEDVIGFQEDPITHHLYFLKTEAKSRGRLTKSVVDEARTSLDANSGCPSPHAVTFIAERLAEAGNHTLSNRLLQTLLVQGINPQQVAHMTFTVSGNNPTTLLSNMLNAYRGPIVAQNAVGIHIEGHGAFISSVYDEVIAVANR